MDTILVRRRRHSRWRWRRGWARCSYACCVSSDDAPTRASSCSRSWRQLALSLVPAAAPQTRTSVPRPAVPRPAPQRARAESSDAAKCRRGAAGSTTSSCVPSANAVTDPTSSRNTKRIGVAPPIRGHRYDGGRPLGRGGRLAGARVVCSRDHGRRGGATVASNDPSGTTLLQHAQEAGTLVITGVVQNPRAIDRSRRPGDSRTL